MGGATTPPGAEPDDMSVSAHEHEAAVHDSKATEHSKKYEPNAREVRVVGPNLGSEALVDYVRNPTDEHRDRARRHRKRAEAHRAAARSLRAFEDSECRDVQASNRRLCPLIGTIESVEDVGDGVRLQVRPGVDATALAAHVRCHFAFGRSAGRESTVRCTSNASRSWSPTTARGSIFARPRAGAWTSCEPAPANTSATEHAIYWRPPAVNQGCTRHRWGARNGHSSHG